MSDLYDKIESIKIDRSFFDLSHGHDFTMEAGKIYPILVDLLMPGDAIELQIANSIRQVPTRAPSLSGFTLITRTFVTAVRNLDKNFYRFLSGFKEYSLEAEYKEPLPKWKPSDNSVVDIGELWEFMGMPARTIPDEDGLPLKFYLDNYNYVWDLYFRNQAIQKSILVDGEPNSSKNEKLLYINWNRDQYTTALPYQALTNPIALPITGTTKANFEDVNINLNEFGEQNNKPIAVNNNQSIQFIGGILKSKQVVPTEITGGQIETVIGNLQGNINLKDKLNNNIVDMKNISSVLISDLRYAFALQLRAEMMARGGVRDNEFLLGQWGTAPNDETLQRPKYLGSSKTRVLTSEVLQTSQTTDQSVLGDMGGHGMGVGESGKIKYHAKEFCVLMTVAYIKPDTLYAQGTPKHLTLHDKFDYPTPVLSHMSEQPIFNREIMTASTVKIGLNNETIGTDETAETYNKQIWGYQPIYNWARYKQSRISGLFKRKIYWEDANTVKNIENLSYWTEARFFSVKDGERPHLNDDFLKVKLDNRNYTVVSDTVERAQFMVGTDFNYTVWRGLSQYGTPGRIDHVI